MIVDPSTPPPDQIGPESGQKNLGTGWEETLTEQTLNLAEKEIPPVTWIREEDFPGTWTPVFTVPMLGQKAGWPRKEQKLLPNEKQLYVFAFANDVSEWLFGTRMFLEEDSDTGVSFTPNPEFDDVDVK